MNYDNLQKELVDRIIAKRTYSEFIQYTFPRYLMTKFHHTCSKILQLFVDGKIRKLMITTPPQHGKTELSTRRLIPYLFGNNPELRIALVSYGIDRSRRFGRQIKQIFDSQRYKNIFTAHLPENTDKNFLNKADMVDVIDKDKSGTLMLAGRGGGLTGEAVDILIMDDIYKNAMEANSPVIRQNIIDWYNMVAETRLHNDSQQLIIFTRWHDQDLVGYIEKNEKVIKFESFNQLQDTDDNVWYKVNFEALKNSPKTDIDDRGMGEALFPEKHNKNKLEITRDRLVKIMPEDWNSIYQGDPRPVTGLLYGAGFMEYERLPEMQGRYAYVDTADQGSDFLCCICYGVGIDNYIYVLDIYYTPDPAETTEREAAEILMRNKIDECVVESNAGGRGFGRNIERFLRKKQSRCTVKFFTQHHNKESRIITSASSILRTVMMPHEWTGKYPAFADAILGFRKLFKSNVNDDAPDALTGCYEHSGIAELDNDIFVGTA